MKKKFWIFFIGIFLFSELGASAPFGEKTSINHSSSLSEYTHMVLAEEATITTCGHCPAVAQYMHEIYTSGEYNFSYVTLVKDKNSYANARINELGVTGYPTVVFDAGYRRIIGDQGGTIPYIAALNLCGERSVADIEITLNISWDGDAEIGIMVAVKNNEGSTFNGHIHVYVTEINSRWWNQETQYHFAMIGDYAMNQVWQRAHNRKRPGRLRGY